MKQTREKCDECGREYPTAPMSVGRSIFHTCYGKFCTDWGQSPDSGCRPKVSARNREKVERERGAPGSWERYWDVMDAWKPEDPVNPERPLTLMWDLLSAKDQERAMEEHDRRRASWRLARPPVFEQGQNLYPFGPDGDPFVVMCLMRCCPGDCVIQDMYYISWQSPINSGEDPQYEELLQVHRHTDYGQWPRNEVKVVCLDERTEVLGTPLVPLEKMLEGPKEEETDDVARGI